MNKPGMLHKSFIKG